MGDGSMKTLGQEILPINMQAVGWRAAYHSMVAGLCLSSQACLGNSTTLALGELLFFVPHSDM